MGELHTNAYRVLAMVAFLSVPVAAAAQVIPPSDQPGRERELFTEPRAPLARPGGEVVTLPSTVAPPGAANIAVFITAVEISGSTVYSADDLASLYAGMIGHEWSLQTVYDLAQRITAKYGNDGYVLSRAVVPPQQLNPQGAVIRIQIVEGWISHVEWPARLSGYRDLFSDYAAKIVADRPANIRIMERYLLLAGDLPGLKFSTSLKPDPDQADASVLVVEVIEKSIDATARLDNRGTAARGPLEYLGSATLNNLAGQHEALTVTWAGVIPFDELKYIGGAYRQVLTSEGLAFFADGSYGWGNLGTAQLQALQYQTLGSYGDAGFSYPVIRSRERNLTLSGLFFASDSQSNVLGAPFNDDRLRGFRAKADADFADRLLGINQFNVTFSQGIDGLGSTENGNPLASRPGGRVDFTKLEATAARTQPLFDRFSAYVSGYAQYGFTELLVPEQCGYGGRYFGRAFDPSQLLSDRCIEAIGELRYDLPAIVPQLSPAQLYSFADCGDLYTISPAPGTPAIVNAASAGVGVRLGWQQRVIADLQLAKAIEGPLDDWRFFFIVTAKY